MDCVRLPSVVVGDFWCESGAVIDLGLAQGGAKEAKHPGEKQNLKTQPFDAIWHFASSQKASERQMVKKHVS